MAPIYFPQSFCGEKASLKLKKELTYGSKLLPEGTICCVLEVLGYAYIIWPLDFDNEIIRIKHGEMEEYFNILDVGVKPWIKAAIIDLNSNNVKKVILKNDFVIKDVVSINKGSEYYATKDINDSGKIFWTLYEIESFEKVLRLRDDEFEAFFIK
jgi:hypothetical protein